MELTVLSAGAVKAGIKAFAEHARRATGHEFKIQYNTTPQIARRIASGNLCDILIAPPSVTRRAQDQDKFFEDSRIYLGKVGAGIVVRAGIDSPEISTAESLEQAVLKADSIVYNQASTGLYLDRLFEEMGIFNKLKRKTKYYPNSAGVLKHIIKGHGNEIGFAAITEIKVFEGQGVKLVGPLPPEIQNWTEYEAVAVRNGKPYEVINAVIQHFKLQATKNMFVNAGIE